MPPSAEDSCVSPTPEISWPHSIQILLLPFFSTLIHILVEGGKNCSPFLILFPLMGIYWHFMLSFLYHLAGTATEERNGVKSMGNNLVKEARLTFVSLFCHWGPTDFEERGFRGSSFLKPGWVAHCCDKGSQVS